MSDVLMGQVRALLAAFGGWLMAKGIIDQPLYDAAIAAAPVLLAMVWSWKAKAGA